MYLYIWEITAAAITASLLLTSKCFQNLHSVNTEASSLLKASAT